MGPFLQLESVISFLKDCLATLAVSFDDGQNPPERCGHPGDWGQHIAMLIVPIFYRCISLFSFTVNTLYYMCLPIRAILNH